MPRPASAAKPATLFIAVGPLCWGVGRTSSEAIRHAARHWPGTYRGIQKPNPKHFSVYSTDAKEATVSDFGNVSVKAPHSLLRVQLSTLQNVS